jgi:hypothetical protein
VAVFVCVAPLVPVIVTVTGVCTVKFCTSVTVLVPVAVTVRVLTMVCVPEPVRVSG